jgi:peptidoglycan hydrolase CwlO-like protein
MKAALRHLELDEKDKLIDELQAELTRHKEMLTSVFEKKNSVQKRVQAFAERFTLLHNENQKLKSRIHRLENPLPPRRRWKSFEADLLDAE